MHNIAFKLRLFKIYKSCAVHVTQTCSSFKDGYAISVEHFTRLIEDLSDSFLLLKFKHNKAEKGSWAEMFYQKNLFITFAKPKIIKRKMDNGIKDLYHITIPVCLYKYYTKVEKSSYYCSRDDIINAEIRSYQSTGTAIFKFLFVNII